MCGMTERDDWPLGPALKAAREKAGLSARAAAMRTGGFISSGRWYQLESGVQKAKGQSVPIGTTPETVIAAALATGWDVSEALTVAGLSASEETVRKVEMRIFGTEVLAEGEEPNWLLYLTALLDYVKRHRDEMTDEHVALLLLECEYLATQASENRPNVRDGLDESIEYGNNLTDRLVLLRDLRNQTMHGKAHDELEAATESGTSRSGDDKKTRAARGRDKVVELKQQDQGRRPEWGNAGPPPSVEEADAASRRRKKSDPPEDHPNE